MIDVGCGRCCWLATLHSTSHSEVGTPGPVGRDPSRVSTSTLTEMHPMQYLRAPALYRHLKMSCRPAYTRKSSPKLSPNSVLVTEGCSIGTTTSIGSRALEVQELAKLAGAVYKDILQVTQMPCLRTNQVKRLPSRLHGARSSIIGTTRTPAAI
jgi:hypothetical protein